MINKKYILSFLVLSFFVFAKLTLKTEHADRLRFLLLPISKLVEMSTNQTAEYSNEKGYYFQQLNMQIDASCSGYNFGLICFLMFSFTSLIQYTSTSIKRLLHFLLAAYFLTILVSFSRIFLTIQFQDRIAYVLPTIDEKTIHSSIGITVYASFLVLIYILFHKIQKSYIHVSKSA